MSRASQADASSKWHRAESLLGEYGFWMLGGPWLDAETEPTLAEAIEHCDHCCEVVLDELDDVEVSYPDLKDDIEFIHHLLYNIDITHKWFGELKQHYFMLKLRVGEPA